MRTLRRILLVTLLLTAVGAVAMRVSPWVREHVVAVAAVGNAGIERAGATVDELLTQRELRFSGLNYLREADLLELLPREESNAWWRLHLMDIEGALVRHPWIRRAQVAPCEDLALRCFTIEVQERSPLFLALDGAQAWLVGDDGSFLAPLPAPEDAPSARVTLRLRNRTYDALPVVYGLVSEGSSPDAARMKTQYVVDALNRIESQVGRPISQLRLRPNGELEVRFEGLRLLAVFDRDTGDGERLVTQTRRLRALFEELEERIRLVQQVDLAFDKLAVVRFVDGATQTSATSNGQRKESGKRL